MIRFSQFAFWRMRLAAISASVSVRHHALVDLVIEIADLVLAEVDCAMISAGLLRPDCRRTVADLGHLARQCRAGRGLARTLREISLRRSPRYRSHARRSDTLLTIFGRWPVRAASPSEAILLSRKRNSIELAFSWLRCATREPALGVLEGAAPP